MIDVGSVTEESVIGIDVEYNIERKRDRRSKQEGSNSLGATKSTQPAVVLKSSLRLGRMPKQTESCLVFPLGMTIAYLAGRNTRASQAKVCVARAMAIVILSIGTGILFPYQVQE
jgi:hypothetical protein